MTKYKLPAEKKQSKETEAVRPGAEYQRHVTLPANDAMVKECKVGESVRIILAA